jgi:hypothetical protein
MRPLREPQHRQNTAQEEHQKRARRLATLVRSVVAMDELLGSMRWISSGIYEIRPGTVSKAKAACAEALYHARDTKGDA